MILGFNADEVFRIAIEIEKNGITFYQKAKDALQDDNLRQVFLELEVEDALRLGIQFEKDCHRPLFDAERFDGRG